MDSPRQSAKTEIDEANDDLSALAWIYDELRRSLESASKALRRHVKETDAQRGADVGAVDPAVLRGARQHLHQSVGALELIGLPAAAAVLRASEHAVQRFVAKPTQPTQGAADAIERTSFALLEYLTRMLAGKPLSALALFPQYRTMQELAGADRVHPADLWPAEWQWRPLPADADALPRPADAGARGELEVLMLDLMRTGMPATAARMSDLFASLGAGAAGQPETATLWRLAAGVFEGQAQGLLHVDNYSKRLGSRLLAQVRTIERGEAVISDRLAHDLLFFCAQCDSPGAGRSAPRLAAVRLAYGLAHHEPIDYDASRLGRFDPSWISQARKRVTAAKDAWSAVAGGEMHRLAGLSEQFQLVADSIRRLYPHGEILAEELSHAAAQAAHNGSAPPAALAMEVATSVLYVEASLEDAELDHPQLGLRVQRLAGRIASVRSGQPPEPLEPWMEELYRRVSDRQTMGSVVQELRAALTDAEKHIDDYFRNPAERSVLVSVPGQLSAMRGVLSVLGMDQASLAVLRMRDEVDGLMATEVDAEHRSANPIFDRLAGNLGALGFLIDMLSVQPQMAKSLFVWDAHAGTLSPVMGRRAASADAPAGEAVQPRLIEQAQSLALSAASEDVPVDAVARDLERLQQQALMADQPTLVATVAEAQAALERADDVFDETAAREHLAQAMNDFVITASEPVGLEPEVEALRATPVPPPPAVAPPPGATGLEDDDEMREVFLEEAREVLDGAREAIGELAHEPRDLGCLTTVRRAFHTLKGSSRMVGLSHFGEAAWACEQLYNTRLADAPEADVPLLEFSAQAFAYLGDWVEAIASRQPSAHDASVVRRAADSLRLDGIALPLMSPSAAASAAEAPAQAEAFAALPPEPAAIEHTPLPEPEFAVPPLAAVDEPDAADDTIVIAPLAEAALPDLPIDAVPEFAALGFPPNLPSAADLEFPSALDVDVPVPDIAEMPEVAEATEAAEGAEAPAVEIDFELDLRPFDEPQPATAENLIDDDATVMAFDLAGLDPADDAPTMVIPTLVDEPTLVQTLPTLADVPTLIELPLADEPAMDELPTMVLPSLHDVVEPAEPAETADTGDVAVEAVDELAIEPTLLLPVEPGFETTIEVGSIDASSASGIGDAAMAEDLDQFKLVGPLRITIPLFNIYLNEADELSRRLDTALAEWALELYRPVGEDTIALAHSLAGSSATVGFSDLSQLARALEHALMRSQAMGSGTADEARLFGDVAGEVRRLLHQFAAGFLKTPDPELLQRLADHELDSARRLEARQAADEASPLVDEALTALVAEELPAEETEAIETAAQVAAQPLADARADARVDADDLDAVDAVDAELFPIFEEEAQDLLPQLASRLRDWAQRPADAGLATACMRTLHTLKGGARLAGAMRLGELAHRLESSIEHLLALDHVPAADIESLQARADALFATFDALRQRDAQAYEAAQAAALAPLNASLAPLGVSPAPEVTPEQLESLLAPPMESASVPDEAQSDAVAIEADSPVAEALTSEVPEAEAHAVAAPIAAPAEIDWSRFIGATVDPLVAAERAGASASQSAVRVRTPLLDRMVNQAGEVSITRVRLESGVAQLRGSLTDLRDNLDRLRTQLRDLELQAETQMSSRLEAAKAAAETFDPLEFDRFTRFQEVTRMMAESVNDVATVQRTLQRTLESAEDELAAQARLTRELQDDLLRTRMVEFDSVADRLHRVVRQAAKETGKQARLEIVGGNIEVDRGVLDRVTGAFEHLLRNGVTHGIELPDVRQAAGKDLVGTIKVALAQEGNEVGVDVSDDGAGLNLQRIRDKALAMGLVDPGAAPGEAELAQLIFAPGFTTADAVTELAGRGIGLDIVRAEVIAMGGRIETATDAGRGTRFKLVLPLTTVVTQVVMLRCADSTVAVPSTLVELVRRAAPAEVDAAYASGSYALGDSRLPFFWLGALLQQSTRGEVAGRSLPVVVIRSAQQRIVVHVDDVLGNQEVVVKNVGPQLARLPGLAGMTLLPSGLPALIYNPVALATLYGDAARSASGFAGSAPAHAEAAAREERERSVPLVLVVDDSLTVRRVTQRMLVREGFRVVLAKDGLDALERLAEALPDVVLSDIEMPRMDGFDLVRNMRGDERWRGLPVIMITSRIAQKHRDHAAELGVNHYLGKPYSEEDLLALIHQYVGVEAAR